MSDADVQTVDRGPRQITRRVIVDAPADELFDLVADPHRHHEIDGSGTVQAKVTGPHRLSPGAKFSVAMTFKVVPYRITSTTTAFTENELIEWQHPMKHRWRWEFRALGDGRTEVTETWDYRDNKAAKVLELMRYPKQNAQGIEKTLAGLAARYHR